MKDRKEDKQSPEIEKLFKKNKFLITKKQRYNKEF